MKRDNDAVAGRSRLQDDAVAAGAAARPRGAAAKGRRRRGGNEASAAASRREMIATAAYFRAERRGFQGGDPAEDWLQAEADVDRLLETQHQGRP